MAHYRHCMLFALPALLGLLASAPVFAQSGSGRAYKWVAADGVTHYSQTPPENAKAEVIEFAGGRSRTVQPAPAAAASVQDTKTALQRANAEYAVKACANARASLELLSSNALVVGSGGVETAKKLNPEQREAAKREAEAQVKEYCDVP